MPDEASEPTSTLVLTTPGRRFVDLRFLSAPHPSASPVAPLSSLEWGFAGRAVGTPAHGKWIHEISSRTAHPERDGEPDEGDIAPHPTLPDVALERGRMRHPGSGDVRAYEEAWRSTPVLPVGGPPSREGKRVAVWLELRETGPGGRRGSVVRVGQYCQGIVRAGAEMAVQRWVCTGGAWTRVAQAGALPMPCEATWSEVDEGGTVSSDDAVWDVREVAIW